jgi:hypothetical protein
MASSSGSGWTEITYGAFAAVLEFAQGKQAQRSLETRDLRGLPHRPPPGVGEPRLIDGVVFTDGSAVALVLWPSPPPTEGAAAEGAEVRWYVRQV